MPFGWSYARQILCAKPSSFASAAPSRPCGDRIRSGTALGGRPASLPSLHPRTYSGPDKKRSDHLNRNILFDIDLQVCYPLAYGNRNASLADPAEIMVGALGKASGDAMGLSILCLEQSPAVSVDVEPGHRGCRAKSQRLSIPRVCPRPAPDVPYGNEMRRFTRSPQCLASP